MDSEDLYIKGIRKKIAQLDEFKMRIEVNYKRECSKIRLQFVNKRFGDLGYAITNEEIPRDILTNISRDILTSVENQIEEQKKLIEIYKNLPKD